MYIRRISNHLHQEKGMTIGHAIATAVNVVRKMCATGDTNWKGKQNVNAGSRAEACAAVASWEKKKASARVNKSSIRGRKLSDKEYIEMLGLEEVLKAGFNRNQKRDWRGRWVDLPGSHAFKKVGVWEQDDGTHGLYQGGKRAPVKTYKSKAGAKAAMDKIITSDANDGMTPVQRAQLAYDTKEKARKDAIYSRKPSKYGPGRAPGDQGGRTRKPRTDILADTIMQQSSGGSHALDALDNSRKNYNRDGSPKKPTPRAKEMREAKAMVERIKAKQPQSRLRPAAGGGTEINPDFVPSASERATAANRVARENKQKQTPSRAKTPAAREAEKRKILANQHESQRGIVRAKAAVKTPAQKAAATKRRNAARKKSQNTTWWGGQVTKSMSNAEFDHYVADADF